MISVGLVLQAYVGLLVHDLYMARHDFAQLHRHVRDFPVRPPSPHAHSAENVASSVDLACCFYIKQILCLQRSVVLVKMLRLNGVPARLIIGAQKLPFKAHAWVEVDGQVVHDRLASRENFYVLEVC